jgi:UDP-N-acetylmuramoyl-tripeptide--D-alanyl-D-alanine ligase
LFFAIQGERFDGHNFLIPVAAQGAAALVVERSKVPLKNPGCAVIAVENTRQALGRLAARYRHDFTLPIVAIGGSNGKTTTKELLASVLREAGPTLWSEASFNNDIGVPLTLLNLEKRHRAAVLEVGTNHPGELAPLVRLVQPQLGVITCIGREHLEFFGDVAGVAREEGWLAELLPSSGTLFLNGDSSWAGPLAARCAGKVVRAGMGSGNAWRASRMLVEETGVSFQVQASQATFDGAYRIPLLGRHQVLNALLALAVGAELGVSPAAARRGLANCPVPKMRLQFGEAQGVGVLDDTYNANADSMLAGLQTLRDLPCAGRRVAVLGEMAELGEHTAAAHREVGQKTFELGISHLVTVGQRARPTAEAARHAGLSAVTECADVAAAATVLRGLLQPGDLVLLKASRAAGLERLGEALCWKGAC